MWAADRFNPFFSRSAAGRRYKGGLCREKVWAVSKNFYPSPSIFVTFKALGLTELWLNVICRKAKNGSPSYAALPKNKECENTAFSRWLSNRRDLTKIRKTPLWGTIHIPDTVNFPLHCSTHYFLGFSRAAKQPVTMQNICPRIGSISQGLARAI